MPTPKKTPKPSRGTFNAKVTTDAIARALIDAETFGDKRAAEAHDVHHRTIENWRVRYRYDPEVVAEMKRLRALLTEGWLDRGRKARADLVDRTRDLAVQSRNLTAVTNALRRVHEVVLSTEIVSEPGDQPDGADQPEDPREAEGED